MSERHRLGSVSSAKKQKISRAMKWFGLHKRFLDLHQRRRAARRLAGE